MENIDENIGRILDDLKKKGLFENTIVVFTYDHGGKDYVNHGELFQGFATLLGRRYPRSIDNTSST